MNKYCYCTTNQNKVMKIYTNLFKLIFTLAIFCMLFFNASGQKVSPIIDIGQNHSDLKSSYMQIHDQYKKQLNPLSFVNNKNQRTVNDETIFLLDTVYIHSTSAGSIRNIYSYSPEGFRLSTLIEKFENGSWDIFTYETSTFDSFGNKLTSLLRIWENGSLTNFSRYSNTYSDDNNLLTSLQEIWENGNWVNSNISTYSYNASGKVTSHLKEYWVNNEWENNSRETYWYDNNSNMLSALGERWFNNSWINDQQYTYTYDANGNMLTGISQNWWGGWQYVTKETYTYNTGNNRISFLEEVWDESVWVNNIKYAFTYDVLDNLQMSIMENWIDNSWVNTEKGQYYYADYNGIETALIENWDSGDWVNFSLTTYNYDEFGNALNGDYFIWENETWTQNQEGPLYLFYNYSTEVESFYGYNVTGAYSSTIVGISDLEIDAVNFLCSPNPASETTTIRFKLANSSYVDISLFTLNGKKIQSVSNGNLNKGEHSYILSTKQLPAGFYIVKLIADNKTQTIKLIVTQ